MKKQLFTTFSAICFAGVAIADAEADPKKRLNRLSSGESHQIAQSCSGGLSVCAPDSYGPGG